MGINKDPQNVIGANLMASFDVVFDQKAEKMGWARAHCDAPGSALPVCGEFAKKYKASAAPSPLGKSPNTEDSSTDPSGKEIMPSRPLKSPSPSSKKGQPTTTSMSPSLSDGSSFSLAPSPMRSTPPPV